LSKVVIPGNVPKRQSLPEAHSDDEEDVEQHVSAQVPAQSPDRQSRPLAQVAPPSALPTELDRCSQAGLTQ
jgi:hypothetical protein